MTEIDIYPVGMWAAATFIAHAFLGVSVLAVT